MRITRLVLLFCGLFLFESVTVLSQESVSKPDSCQPSIDDILSSVKIFSHYTPSPNGVWMTGEITAGWQVLSMREPNMSLLIALAYVGGNLDTASGTIYVIRQTSNDNSQTILVRNIHDIEQGSAKDLALEKGDLVFVSRGCNGRKLRLPTRPKSVPNPLKAWGLSADDKIQIVNSILKSYKFGIPDSSDTKKKNIHLVLPDEISPEQISPIKNINFVFIGDKEIEKLKETGGNYFRFGEFGLEESFVWTGLTEIGIGGDRGWGQTTNLECRKDKSGWKIKTVGAARFHFYL